ncbi:MAG: DUF805 domain-containing protein [Polaribacter sp.]
MNWYIKVLTNYINFKGRARRKEFWMFALINGIIMYVLASLPVWTGMTALAYVSSIYSLIVLLPSIAVAVRRIQDLDKQWFFILIPIYNIILFATEGTKGSNKFGEDPKA